MQEMTGFEGVVRGLRFLFPSQAFLSAPFDSRASDGAVSYALAQRGSIILASLVEASQIWFHDFGVLK